MKQATIEEITRIHSEMREQPDWRQQADREAEYYDGKQLDSQLLKELESKGIPPAIENLIAPAIDDVIGMQEKEKRDWRVMPDDSDGAEEIALALNQELNTAERKTKADRACATAYEGQVKVGIHWVEVSREPNLFKTPYRVIPVHRNEIYWDMKARMTDLSDARWLIRRRWTDADLAAAFFPKHKRIIEELGAGRDELETLMHVEGGGSTDLFASWEDQRGYTIDEAEWRDPTNRRVCIYEHLYKCFARAIALKLPDNRIIEYDKNNPLHQIALANGAEAEKTVVERIRKAFWLGRHKLADVPSEFSKFNYVPFWGKKEDMTGVPYGIVRNMMYLQDEVNARSSKIQWQLTATRVERTEGVVDMTDDQFRQVIGRPDADIRLNRKELAKPGARFDVHEGGELNRYQYERLLDLRESIKRVSNVTDAFSGHGGADSGVGLSKMIEQSVQALARMNSNFAEARSDVGDLLLTLILKDMKGVHKNVRIKGQAGRQDRVVALNEPAVDPDTGAEYLNNDIARVKLKVELADVPSTPTFRQQQLSAMEQVLKSLPENIQHVLTPHFAELTDIPDKEEVIKAIREAMETPTPDEIQQQTQEAIEQAKKEWLYELKQREVDIKERKTEAEIEKMVTEQVNNAIEAVFSATKAGQEISLAPQIAPIADQILKSAGYEDQDEPPIVQQPGAAMQPATGVEPTPQNTSPNFPPRVQEEDLEPAVLPEQQLGNPAVGMGEGIET